MFSWVEGDRKRRMNTENPEPPFKRDRELLLESVDDDTRFELNLIGVMTDISAALINYRADKSLSQKELAEKLECSQAMVSKIESGDYNFTIRKLFDVVNKLGGRVSLEIDFKDDTSIPDSSEERVSIWEYVGNQSIKGMKNSA
ncbi:helix-turn-helix transcriptional regulator [Mesotoga sp.]|uniref:helix-turn-helix transcriptional regulator n=1 Tax=Mesotoga sp. TaxID=2053577 RepID=UPI001BD63C02|nr:helix-turn-helix transcriptional regulator [Mesotoga sp.]